MSDTPTTFHVSASIEGMLKQYQRKKINFLEDDEGNSIPLSEVKNLLQQALDNGEKYIKSKGCDNFDPKRGCLGHPKQLTGE